MNTPDYIIERVTKKAMDCIRMYGKLRWCQSQICACMGCANHKMSRTEYDIALTIPAIQDEIRKRKENSKKYNIIELMKNY